MTMNRKKILLIVLGLLVLASVLNLMTGTTTIMINGKQVTSPLEFITAYLGLIALTVLLVILIPSLFVVGVLLAILLGVMILLFFPLMPIGFHLFPAIILALIVWLVYRLVRKKKQP